jgi:hypothetical protein
VRRIVALSLVSLLLLGIASCDEEEETGDSRADADADADTDTDADGDVDSDTDVDTGPTDGDGDGWTVVGGDCDDADPTVHPEAEEIAGDGVDQDCDSHEACFQDFDGDGYGASSALTSEDLDCSDPGESAVSTDCDDGNPEVSPAAVEVCEDGVDDDCSGSDLRCGSWGAVDLSEADAKLVGDGGDFAGCSVAVGDVDGDGAGDVLVGADHSNGGGVNAGGACLVLGPISGTLDLSLADSRFVGEEASDAAGVSVATGDVDGDRDGEILVGSWYSGAAGACAGAVYLILDPVSGTFDLSEADAKLVGEGAYALAGSSAAAGDVDGDDVEEILVGAHQEDEGGTYAGAAYVVSGPVSGTTSLTLADAKLVGEEIYDYAGVSVAAGDVDGDGVEDILVGASGSDAGGVDSGAVYVVSGPVSGTLDLAEADAKLVGDTGDLAGASVSSGDVDGDGVGDVIAGAPAGLVTYLVLGAVSGTASLSLADTKLVGEAFGDNTGSSVSSGDVDGDGVDEILVGAFFEGTGGSHAGAAYVVLEHADGTVDLSLADAKLMGEAAGDQAGISIAAGDTDGDGAQDVLVGANGQDAGGIGAGAVYLLLGGGS